MSPAREGRRVEIATADILFAIATRGARWTSRFGADEVGAVTAALDRELLAGTLVDATTLSWQGEAELDRLLGRSGSRLALEVRIDVCADHGMDVTCWTISCTRCGRRLHRHVPDPEVEQLARAAAVDHDCPGAEPGPPVG